MAAPASDAPARRLAPWPWGWGLTLGLVVLACLAGPWLLAHGPLTQDPAGLDPFGTPLPPSWQHWLGTDELGRDVLARVLHGGRASLVIAGGATLLAGAIGVALGLWAGYVGRWADAFVMRATEVVMAFPTLLLAIALAAVLPRGPLSVTLTLALVGWTSIARLTRGAVLQVKGQEFVEASLSVGASHLQVVWRHVLPNVAPLAATLIVLKLADMLLLEAALGFLGLGVPAPDPTWGSLIGQSRLAIFHHPWIGLPAGALVFLTVLASAMLIERLDAKGARR